MASTSVRLSEQGSIEDVKVIDHNPSKVVSFFDNANTTTKYSYSDRLSKLKSKLNTLSSSLDGGSKSGLPLSKEEDKLKKKIKQQKKEIELLTKDVKELQSTASKSIASHQSPLLVQSKEGK